LPLILVVDDDKAVAQTIAACLHQDGHEVLVSNNGNEALELAERNSIDLFVLDVMMPGMDGFEVCRRLRNNPSSATAPIIFLTALAELEDKVEGFLAGGDDYLTKPFDLEELELRVRAVLRRSAAARAQGATPTLAVGSLTLNPHTFEVSVDDRVCLLTPREFSLLEFLMTHAGRVFTSRELLNRVWGYPPDQGSSALVRVHIRNLREKIEEDPSHPKLLRTVSHHGYTISPRED
jgi:DNA-binding response OmpR family regulator